MNVLSKKNPELFFLEVGGGGCGGGGGGFDSLSPINNLSVKQGRVFLG